MGRRRGKKEILVCKGFKTRVLSSMLFNVMIADAEEAMRKVKSKK